MKYFFIFSFFITSLLCTSCSENNSNQIPELQTIENPKIGMTLFCNYGDEYVELQVLPDLMSIYDFEKGWTVFANHEELNEYISEYSTFDVMYWEYWGNDLEDTEEELKEKFYQ